MITQFQRCVARVLIVVLIAIGVPLPAQAAMIGTEALAGSPAHARIAAALDRADVQGQLRANGVDPAEAKARAAALSDTEAAELAARIDSLPAGGVSVLGALLLSFLVLLVTDILGFTKVFPFTRPVK